MDSKSSISSWNKSFTKVLSHTVESTVCATAYIHISYMFIMNCIKFSGGIFNAFFFCNFLVDGNGYLVCKSQPFFFFLSTQYTTYITVIRGLRRRGRLLCNINHRKHLWKHFPKYSPLEVAKHIYQHSSKIALSNITTYTYFSWREIRSSKDQLKLNALLCFPILMTFYSQSCQMLVFSSLMYQV